jgi:tetrathionate reductase subunit B
MKDRELSPPCPREQSAECDRREFLRKSLPASFLLVAMVQDAGSETSKPGEEKSAPGAKPAGYTAAGHKYGMGVDTARCIGCGRCAEACKAENDVPREPFYYRTWVERFVIRANAETVVSSPNGGIDGFPPVEEPNMLRTFFVPKLCNHCANPPCVQVCPVGATFSTPDGVVLVDQHYCIGCRYCIQACPYGARFLHPVTRTAEKCTFCYHRVVQGLVPACVEVCPTQARIFGDMESTASPLKRFMRQNKIQALKPHLNTEPKVVYANLDGEVS